MNLRLSPTQIVASLRQVAENERKHFSITGSTVAYNNLMEAASYIELLTHLQPMESAPRNRAILVRQKSKYLEPHEEFSVVIYAKWDETVSFSGMQEEVWQEESGKGIPISSPDLVGWYELPQ